MYGPTGHNPDHISPHGMDCGDVEDHIPKGFRIRNKKAKRRFHKKRTRQLAVKEINKEVNSIENK